MTNEQKTEAPERIYLSKQPHDINRDEGVDALGFAWKKPRSNGTQYTRTDLANAAADTMIAAEREAVLREARQVVRCLCDQLEAHGYDGFACGGIDFLKNTQSSDQPSALDKALAEAKAEG